MCAIQKRYRYLVTICEISKMAALISQRFQDFQKFQNFPRGHPYTVGISKISEISEISETSKISKMPRRKVNKYGLQAEGLGTRNSVAGKAAWRVQDFRKHKGELFWKFWKFGKFWKVWKSLRYKDALFGNIGFLRYKGGLFGNFGNLQRVLCTSQPPVQQSY